MHWHCLLALQYDVQGWLTQADPAGSAPSINISLETRFCAFTCGTVGEECQLRAGHSSGSSDISDQTTTRAAAAATAAAAAGLDCATELADGAAAEASGVSELSPVHVKAVYLMRGTANNLEHISKVTHHNMARQPLSCLTCLLYL